MELIKFEIFRKIRTSNCELSKTNKSFVVNPKTQAELHFIDLSCKPFQDRDPRNNIASNNLTKQLGLVIASSRNNYSVFNTAQFTVDYMRKRNIIKLYIYLPIVVITLAEK